MSQSSRSRVRLSTKTIATYSAACACVVASQSSEAGIIYNTVNVLVQDTTLDGNPVSFGLAFGAANSFTLTMTHNIQTTNSSTGVARAIGMSVAGFSNLGFYYATKLTYGQQIAPQAFLSPGQTATMAFNAYPGLSQFKDPGVGILGVKFGANYGWVRVNMSGEPLNSFQIIDYAFSTAGEEIFAGQTTIVGVPEPSSLALLAIGASGLAAWRQRKQKRKEAAKTL